MEAKSERVSFGLKRKAEERRRQVPEAFQGQDDDDYQEEEKEEGVSSAKVASLDSAVVALEDPSALFRRLRREGETLAEAGRFWRAIHTWQRGLEAVLEGGEVRRHGVAEQEIAEVLEMKAQALMQV